MFSNVCCTNARSSTSNPYRRSVPAISPRPIIPRHRLNSEHPAQPLRQIMQPRNPHPLNSANSQPMRLKRKQPVRTKQRNLPHRPQHTMNLPQRRILVRNMLQHLVHDHRVEMPIRKRHRFRADIEYPGTQLRMRTQSNPPASPPRSQCQTHRHPARAASRHTRHARSRRPAQHHRLQHAAHQRQRTNFCSWRCRHRPRVPSGLYSRMCAEDPSPRSNSLECTTAIRCRDVNSLRTKSVRQPPHKVPHSFAPFEVSGKVINHYHQATSSRVPRPSRPLLARRASRQTTRFPPTQNSVPKGTTYLSPALQRWSTKYQDPSPFRDGTPRPPHAAAPFITSPHP